MPMRVRDSCHITTHQPSVKGTSARHSVSLAANRRDSLGGCRVIAAVLFFLLCAGIYGQAFIFGPCPVVNKQ